MVRRAFAGTTLWWAALVAVSSSAFAGWSFNGGPSPNAFIQARNVTLELACDRMRFAPAGYEDARDIERKQGLSIRFMKDGATEVGAFQAGADKGNGEFALEWGAVTRTDLDGGNSPALCFVARAWDPEATVWQSAEADTE